MLDIIQNKKSLKKELLALSKAISESRVYVPQHVRDFIFLCGANINDSTISKRRSALMEFAKINLPHTQFFLAEKIFPILVKEGHKGNLLDIENEISVFSDKIVVVLESPSAFTELGVFSHKKLREKLIVINDTKFINSKSFINMGPVKAIEEASGEDHIIYYKMRESGISQLDSIGDVFASLHEILKTQRSTRHTPISLLDCNPAINFNKISAMMVHDLIYFSGPIKHTELIQVLLIIFGKHSFQLREHAGLLVAIESIIRTEKGWYKSILDKPYYHYKFDIHGLISTYRNYMHKFYPERLYGD